MSRVSSLAPPGPREQARSVVRYLVTKRLAGDIITLLAVKRYLVDEDSPRDIAWDYRLSKYKVRGWIQRIVEKCNGSYRLATAVVERSWRLIYQVQPIVVKVGGCWVCLECNAEVLLPERHVRVHHKAEIEAATEWVMRRILNGRKR